MLRDRTPTLETLATRALISEQGHVLAAFADRHVKLTPQQIAQHDAPLRDAWRKTMRHIQSHGQTNFLAKWQSNGAIKSLWARVETNPDFARLCAHSSDGYLRETAMLTLPLDTPATRAVLLLRCNDWVPQVAKAAQTRLAAELPTWRVADIRTLGGFILARLGTWQRGGAAALDSVLTCQAGALAMTHQLLHATNGPLAKLFAHLARIGVLDDALPQLALRARSSLVRAKATQSIVQAKLRWRTGTGWQWIDKPAGLRRRVHLMAERAIAMPPAVQDRVLRAACHDKNVLVRKLAVDQLIIQGPSGFETEISRLRQDSRPAVTWRMAYLDRKWGNPMPPSI